MSRDLAIDLGTANTLVYASGKGIVLNEPSVIAVNSKTNQVLAVGQNAWEMIGRTPGHIVAVRPLRSGAITDFDITQKMIRLVLQKAGVSRLTKPKVIICVPSAITEVETRAVEEATRQAGASDVILLEQPFAAAIGANLPVSEPIGSMIIDIGGGTSECAIISLGGIVTSKSVRIGGFDLDGSVQTYLRREYGLAVGEKTAENIKVAIGAAWLKSNPVKAEVKGRDILTGLPKIVIINRSEIYEAIKENINDIVNTVKQCLAEAPPDLSQDLISYGIHLTGGSGQLTGLDQRLADDTMLPIQLVDAPLECVVLGAGKCLKSFEHFKDYYKTKHRRKNTGN
jgi:rod shape-determining protein MreB